jgi:hypothetical protein
MRAEGKGTDSIPAARIVFQRHKVINTKLVRKPRWRAGLGPDLFLPCFAFEGMSKH